MNWTHKTKIIQNPVWNLQNTFFLFDPSHRKSQRSAAWRLRRWRTCFSSLRVTWKDSFGSPRVFSKRVLVGLVCLGPQRPQIQLVYLVFLGFAHFLAGVQGFKHPELLELSALLRSCEFSRFLSGPSLLEKILSDPQFCERDAAAVGDPEGAVFGVALCFFVWPIKRKQRDSEVVENMLLIRKKNNHCKNGGKIT